MYEYKYEIKLCNNLHIQKIYTWKKFNRVNFKRTSVSYLVNKTLLKTTAERILNTKKHHERAKANKERN